jgi:8-oxo-dGTP pyrophosphatase MutT (NUDIX family)
MTTYRKLHTVGLIVLKEGKLLLAYSNNKKAWYLPGGKVDANETVLEAIDREIREELNVRLDVCKLKFYCHITAPAFGEGNNVIMEQDCFIYPLNEGIHPSNEIGAINYFDLIEYMQQPIQVPGVFKVFEFLQKQKNEYSFFL